MRDVGNDWGATVFSTRQVSSSSANKSDLISAAESAERGLRAKVQSALRVKELEVAQDVLFDFLGRGFAVEFLQFGDKLGDGVFAVAARDNFKAGAVETEGAFRH